MTEDQLQAKCFQYAYNAYPILRGVFFSVPNGGTRNIREAQKLKATGLQPGIPDMILIHNGIHGFEFKTEIGKLSDAQKKIHNIWTLKNIPVYVVRNFEGFVKILELILKVNDFNKNAKF